MFAGALQLNAQSRHFGGLFPTIDHSGKLSEKLGYGLYVFGAFPLVNITKPDFSKDNNFLLFYSEKYLTYNLTNTIFLTGSYVYQRENVLRKDYVNENRFYLQAKFKHIFKPITISHRVRFDARFIQNRTNDTYSFKHRLRYLIGAESDIAEHWYVNAYEELFFNTFKNASPSYAENWAYAGLGKKLNARNKLEIGILYVTWNIKDKVWFNQYYLQLTWLSHIDFTRKYE